MKKFLIGLAAGLVLAGLALVALLFAAMRVAEPRAVVPDDSTLVIGLEGDIPERPPMTLPFPALESRVAVTLQDVWLSLAEAAADPRIRAVVFEPAGVSAGWGKLQEIHSSLVRFKESGKPLVAYLRNPATREYYLATAADRIVMAPEDYLNLKGLRIEAMYLKGTLDKLGVDVEFEHAGRYKDAGDMFARDSMRPETREVLNSILDSVFAHLIETVAAGRKRTEDQIRAAIDQGPFLAVKARDLGLVDELTYEDQTFDRIKSDLGLEEIRRVSHRVYSQAVLERRLSSPDPTIALVVGSGTILGGSGGDGLGDQDVVWSRDFVRLLGQVRDDSKVKGVILRIDSPGGDAIASDEILHEVRRLSEKKPLVISMSDVAASGGYYIAMTGDPVVAYPNTLTGSIGVIYGKANLRGLYDKLGIKKEVLSRGRFADIDSDYTALSPEGRAKLRESIDAIYRGFLARVAEGRKLDVSKVEPLAEGRVWLGGQAHGNGLVDELGGLDVAVDLVKRKAGIAAGQRIRLLTYPARKSFWTYLLERSADSAVAARLREAFGGFDPRLLRATGVLRLMPYRLVIQ